MYYVSRIFAYVSLLALIAAAWFSIHLARADSQFRRGDPDSVARALAIEPRNIDYLALRAIQLDYDGADSAPLLERAAALNPTGSSPRIRLGLAAEIRGDYASAERWLLDAARVDRQFEPRWTLANYYFRRADTRNFWHWVREALEVSYGDRRPAFELCWRMGSPAEILSEAIPDRREVLAAYLAFVLDSHRDSIGPVALKLARFRESVDRPILLAACDALINSQDAAAAIALWRAMDLAPPSSIFNGDFAIPLLNHGFDWRILESPGITHTSSEAIPSTTGQALAAHRILLHGRQPESCALLIQILSLEPHARYRLRWESRTSGIARRSGSDFGVTWRIADLRAPIVPSDSLSTGEATFIAPGELAPLTLFYQRPSGEPRAEGSIDLTRVSIDRAR